MRYNLVVKAATDTDCIRFMRKWFPGSIPVVTGTRFEDNWAVSVFHKPNGAAILNQWFNDPEYTVTAPHSPATLGDPFPMGALLYWNDAAPEVPFTNVGGVDLFSLGDA